MGSSIVRIDRLFIRAEIGEGPSQIKITAIAVVSYPYPPPLGELGGRRSETFSSNGIDVNSSGDSNHFKVLAHATLKGLKVHLEKFCIDTEGPFRDASLNAVDIYPDADLCDVDLFNRAG